MEKHYWFDEVEFLLKNRIIVQFYSEVKDKIIIAQYNEVLDIVEVLPKSASNKSKKIKWYILH